MRQVVQDLRSGRVEVIEVPEPSPRPGFVLVAVERSLISSGTERALAELGAKSLLGKARSRPDLVRKAIDVARSEGIGAAAAKVHTRLDRYLEFGYSVAGRVLDSGGDPRLAAGTAVVGVGSGFASHAEVVSVPAALVVRLPRGVDADAAAFAAPAAIALHGLRLSGAEAGSVVAVLGLGLVGQLAGRLARAAGCTVVGMDPLPDRAELFGAAAAPEGFAELVSSASRGRGADAVLVCAATSSSDPVNLAAEVARDRASLVVVGDVGLELERRALYEKELTVTVARSYGPGRYDRDYEERGLDYPVGHVRWTEGRNVEAVLDLIAAGSLEPLELVTHRFPVSEGDGAYELLRSDSTALGILLEHSPAPERSTRVGTASAPRTDVLRVGLIGAGAFARGTLAPAFTKAGATLAAVCARTGASAQSFAAREQIGLVTTDWRQLVASGDVDAVAIATPHAEHAEMAAAALESGLAVFVEKPLAVTQEGLARVAAAAAGDSVLLVGHNRRFAPLAVRLRDAVPGPKLIAIRVAAGPLAPGHWLEDPEHGGRVLGEISHFVDLASFLAGTPPRSVVARAVPVSDHEHSLLATLSFDDGSAATIAYGSGESSGLAKERIEVLGAAGAAVLDDFTRLDVHGPRKRTEKERRDKGHAAQVAAFVEAALGKRPAPVPLDEQLLVAAASLAALDSARTGEPVAVSLPA